MVVVMVVVVVVVAIEQGNRVEKVLVSVVSAMPDSLAEVEARLVAHRPSQVGLSCEHSGLQVDVGDSVLLSWPQTTRDDLVSAERTAGVQKMYNPQWCGWYRPACRHTGPCESAVAFQNLPLRFAYEERS